MVTGVMGDSTTSAAGSFGSNTSGVGTTSPATSDSTTVTSDTATGTNTASATSGGGATGNADTATATTGLVGGCTFTVNAEISQAISTVGIITWSVDASVASAEVQFGPADAGFTMSAPVDLNEPDYRTLLLGMKGERAYVFQVVATTDQGTCSSERGSLTTGPIPNSVPTVTREVMNAGAVAPGFLVASAGIGNLGGGMIGGGSASPAYILDHEGDVVWYADAPSQTSRAKMDWEGKNMWLLALNVSNTGGEMRRVSMDGLDVERNVAGLSAGHHDFTVLPGGVVASIPWAGSGNAAPSEIIERSPDGTIKTVVVLDSNIYQSSGFHANSIHYHPSDDSYTVGDRTPSLYVKVTRQGELLWQFGGNNPVGPHFQGNWSVNHGHHYWVDANGSSHFLFFNNGMGGSSPALEFVLDEATMTATQIWDHSSTASSPTLGDAQRLPNGNTLVTYSNAGVIHEVDPSGALVQSFSVGSVGYVEHRSSLYGPPPR